MIELFECFRDGMVLQRDCPVGVWGWAKSHAHISVMFRDRRYGTEANGAGEWTVVLDESPSGGPFEMSVSDGSETVVIRDILFGDVYLAAGQSNMELPLSRTLDSLGEEFEKIHNPLVREFRVPISFSFDGPARRLPGGSWKPATGGNRSDLGAVAYHFASSLQERYGIPVGIVNISAGGSPVEAWLPEQSIRDAGGYDEILSLCKDGGRVAETVSAELDRAKDWYLRLDGADKGLGENSWKGEVTDDGPWESVRLPFYFRDHPGLCGFLGSVWFRKTVEIPEGTNLANVRLFLGAMIDADEVFVNGIFAGKTEYMYPPRRYAVPDGLLRHGKNLVAIRLVVNRGSGGFVAGKKYALCGTGWNIDLAGEWKFSVGTRMVELPQTTFFHYKPAGLFNAMLSPLAPFRFRGIIWYQGESNDRNPEKYESLFGDMIRQWRRLFAGAVPFMYVQLANFDDPTKRVPRDSWALLRDAQRKILALPETAMAVTIDAGEGNDLHPQDKKTVGLRLALCAQELVYGETIEYSGPCCESALLSPDRAQVLLSFSHMEGGPVLRNAPARYFEFGHADGTYRAAEAVPYGDLLALRSAGGDVPVSVRYGWVNNPENPDLFNRSGLPASPFAIQVTW